MKGHYNKNSKLDFGMYKDYELGIVYVFDPSYIDWCINNIDNFFITDLDELKKYGVINEKIDTQYRMIGDPSLIPNIDLFDTFQLLIDNFDLGDKRYKFSDETLRVNDEKLFGRQQIDLLSDKDIDDDNVGGRFHRDYEEYEDSEYYDGDYDQENSITDTGCGEGYSCSECTNGGCPAHPLN